MENKISSIESKTSICVSNDPHIHSQQLLHGVSKPSKSNRRNSGY